MSKTNNENLPKGNSNDGRFSLMALITKIMTIIIITILLIAKNHVYYTHTLKRPEMNHSNPVK